MARLADGSFYRVVATVETGARHTIYQGASLQTAEKRFGGLSHIVTHFAEIAFKKPYDGIHGVVSRIEIRLYNADGISYRVWATWRKDMNCNQIFNLLSRVNHPKFTEQLYHNVSDRDLREAEKATDEIAPLISKYQLQFCYREDGWTYWHGHDCHCAFTERSRTHAERISAH